MKKEDVNKILNDGFKIRFKNLGFKKNKIGFSKELNDKFSIRFGYSIIDYGSVFPSTFSFSLSSVEFDKIYSKILETDRTGLWIYSTGIGSLYEIGKYSKPKHEIISEDDCFNMVEEATCFMTEVAIPYLNSISNFKALDDYYNQNPTRPDFGVRSLIIAKMAGNPNYEELKTTYRQLFIDKNWAVKEDVLNLEKVIAFLDTHEKEEIENIAIT